MTRGRAVLGFAGALFLGIVIALLLLRGGDPSGKSAGGPSAARDPATFPARRDAARSADPPAASAVPAAASAKEGGGSAIQVPMPYSVTVRLADADGRPVGARPVALHWVNEGERLVGRAGTDDEGKHRWNLPDRGLYVVVAEDGRGGRRVSPAVELTQGKPHAEIRIVLGRFVLTGRLDRESHDAKGETAVPGQEPLEIRLAPAGSTDTQRGGFAARVDEKGDFSIAEVPAGEYVLSVPAKFHFEPIRVDRDLYHVVRLSRGKIHGRIFDKSTGTGVKDVQIVLNAVSIDGLDPAIAPPNLMDRFSPTEDGSFAFTSLPAGRYRLFANGGRCGSQIREATLTGASDIQRVDFELEAGALIDARAVDAAGRPLQNPLFRVNGLQWGFSGVAAGVKPGTFSVLGHARGHTVVLRKGVVFKAGETTTVVFVLEPHVPIEVQFVDASGAPIPGVECAVDAGGFDIQKLMQSIHGGNFAVSDGSGVVRVWGLAAGGYPLVARKGGYDELSVEVAVSAGKTRVVLKMTAVH